MSDRPAFVRKPPPPEAPSERQICSYISEMCAELRQLARGPRFRIVNYLLDMAKVESDRMAKEASD